MRYFRESLAVVYDKVEVFMDQIQKVLFEYAKLRDENAEMAFRIGFSFDLLFLPDLLLDQL